jgi:hypothetical protein
VLFTLALVDFLARNDLAPVEIQRLDLELVPHDEPRLDELVAAHALDARLAPGASTELVVELRQWRSGVERVRVPFTVPADAPDGRLVVLLGDGARIDAARFALEPPAPRSFEQARALLASLGSARDLALLAVVPGRGLVAAGAMHPRLPPTAAALLAPAASGRPIRAAIAARAAQARPRPLAGLVRVDHEVDRRAPVKGEGTNGAGGRARERPGG